MGLNSASIDLRFDQPNDFTPDGLLVNSFANVKKTIDRVKSVGFNSINIDTNVPINVDSGDLQLTTPSGNYNTNKQLPQDIWKIVDYAKSVGLVVKINLNIVNAINDVPIQSTNVGANFSSQKFFNSIKSYETQIAGLAQLHKVDQIDIGVFNAGFDTSQYLSNWSEVISSMRGVFSGKLGYVSDYRSNNVVWNLVDVLAMNFNPVLSRTPLYDPTQIIPSYFQTQDDSQHGGSHNAFIKLIQTIEKYPNKVYELSNLMISPAMSAVGNVINLAQYVYTDGFSTAPGKDSRVAPNLKFDNSLMVAWYQSFFEFFGNYLADKVSSISYFQYAPWADATWIKNSQGVNGLAFNSYAKGTFLNYQAEAEAIISAYIKNPWGWHNIFYGTAGNDVLSGTSSLDKAIYSGSLKEFKISAGDKLQATIVDSVANRNGTDTLTNIERLQFTDKNIALDLAPTQSAGKTALLLGAVLPGQLVYDVSKQALVGAVVNLFDQNYTLAELSGAILRLPIWDVLTGKAAPTNADIAGYLVNNVYGGTQTAAITNAAIAAMNAETPATQGSYLASLAAGEANQAHINLVGIQSAGLVYLG